MEMRWRHIDWKTPTNKLSYCKSEQHNRSRVVHSVLCLSVWVSMRVLACLSLAALQTSAVKVKFQSVLNQSMEPALEHPSLTSSAALTHTETHTHTHTHIERKHSRKPSMITHRYRQKVVTHAQACFKHTHTHTHKTIHLMTDPITQTNAHI